MPSPTPESWALIRHDYEHTQRPLAEICAGHGISTGTLRDRVRRWNWTRRRVAIPSEGPPPTPPPFVATMPRAAPAPSVETSAPLPAEAPQPDVIAPPPLPLPDDGTPIAARLQTALARVLPAIEAVLAKLAASPQPREMETAARSLGSLTRALRELNALLGQYPDPAGTDRGPEDDDEFVRELVRRMDHFAAQHAASGGGPPDGS